MASSDFDHDQEIIDDFVAESRDALRGIEAELLELERDNSQQSDSVDRIFRAVHTVKGSSSFLQLTPIVAVTHRAETLLAEIRDGQREAESESVSLILRAVDAVLEMLDSEDLGSAAEIDGLLESFDETLGIESKREVQSTREAGSAELAAWEEAAQSASSGLHDIFVAQVLPRQLHGISSGNPREYIERLGSILLVGEGDAALDGETEQEVTVFIESMLDKPFLIDYLQIADEAIRILSSTSESASQATSTSSASSQDDPSPNLEASPSRDSQPEPSVGKNGEREKRAALAEKQPSPSRDASKTHDPIVKIPASVLDRLLQVTGDMVMCRNQLIERHELDEDSAFSVLASRVTEVHETVIQTRMRTTESLFGRFRRVLRDLALKFEKEIRVEIEGGELELDRSILDAFADPLTHLVRNCADHAIETPEQRAEAGKPPEGTVWLRSLQRDGEIILEVEDDGRGIDPDRIGQKAVEKGVIDEATKERLSPQELLQLIFEPGFSTKDQVSDVSGRGVGMDVVRTNVEQMGGVIELHSEPGLGTRFSVHLPIAKALVASSLTRALIVQVSGTSLAIPESAVNEIISASDAQSSAGFRRLDDRLVFHLRGEIIPVVFLAEAVGAPHQVFSEQEQQFLDAPELPQFATRNSTRSIDEPRDEGVSQPFELDPFACLVIVRHRNHRFALFVNDVLGVREVIVQPTPALLEHCSAYSGHAVMGDGRCVMILDINGIVSRMDLRFREGRATEEPRLQLEGADAKGDQLLVFNFSEDEYFAIPMDLVALVEPYRPEAIERVGDTLYYRDEAQTTSLLFLDKYLNARPISDDEHLPRTLIHPAKVDLQVALVGGSDIQVIEMTDTFRQRSTGDEGVLGLLETEHRIVNLIDLYKLLERSLPDRSLVDEDPHGPELQILCADDSVFFRKLLSQYLDQPNWTVTFAHDGQQAWQLISQFPERFDVVISDINMPEMDGFELSQMIRSDGRFGDLPLMALTTQADEESRRMGLAMGFDRYVAKINKVQIHRCIHELIDEKRKRLAQSN